MDTYMLMEIDICNTGFMYCIKYTFMDEYHKYVYDQLYIIFNREW